MDTLEDIITRLPTLDEGVTPDEMLESPVFHKVVQALIDEDPSAACERARDLSWTLCWFRVIPDIRILLVDIDDWRERQTKAVVSIRQAAELLKSPVALIKVPPTRLVSPDLTDAQNFCSLALGDDLPSVLSLIADTLEARPAEDLIPGSLRRSMPHS